MQQTSYGRLYSWDLQFRNRKKDHCDSHGIPYKQNDSDVTFVPIKDTFNRGSIIRENRFDSRTGFTRVAAYAIRHVVHSVSDSFRYGPNAKMTATISIERIIATT